MTMRVAIVAMLVIGASAHAQEVDAGKAAFREIYQEMVEIDSSPSTGSCTKVVRAAEARLQTAGFAAGDLQVVIPEGKPDDGNLVARIHAPGAKKKGVLLLAHIDVVDAKRADWERDPFKLVEERRLLLWPRRSRRQGDGRRVSRSHDPPEAGTRLQAEARPHHGAHLRRGDLESRERRGLSIAEQARAHRRGVRHQRGRGRPALAPTARSTLVLHVQAGEKIHQVYTLEVTNKGGHSSRPERDNAIYRLARATLEDRTARVSARAHARRARVFPRHGPDARQ